MQRSVVILSVVVGAAALFGASTPSPVSSARAAEVLRLERHFDSVDVELRSRDVSQFTASQKANRATLIGWLRDYRNGGRFPQNDRFEKPTPYFRDRNGVLCAMAYLIDRSGRGDFVDKVAATRNNAYIRELADDPALITWLDTWGLSVAEAARIQPEYGGFPDDPVEDDNVDDDVALAAIGLSSVSLASAAFNVARPSYFSGFVGIVAGVGSIIAGANWLDENEGTKSVGTATVAIGAASLGAGIYGLLEARRNDHHDRDRWGRRRRFSFNVAPDVAIRSEKPALGVLVRGKF